MSYHGLRASRVSTPESIFNHGIERSLNLVLSKPTQQLRVNRLRHDVANTPSSSSPPEDSLRLLPSDDPSEYRSDVLYALLGEPLLPREENVAYESKPRLPAGRMLY
jgi:hypothetical protein